MEVGTQAHCLWITLNFSGNRVLDMEVKVQAYLRALLCPRAYPQITDVQKEAEKREVCFPSFEKLELLVFRTIVTYN